MEFFIYIIRFSFGGRKSLVMGCQADKELATRHIYIMFVAEVSGRRTRSQPISQKGRRRNNLVLRVNSIDWLQHFCTVPSAPYGSTKRKTQSHSFVLQIIDSFYWIVNRTVIVLGEFNASCSKEDERTLTTIETKDNQSKSCDRHHYTSSTME